MTDARLEVENLHLWRGEQHVLRGVHFALQAGQCLEVTGANGSGKTSLLRTLCGLMYPEEGRVLWNGSNVRADLPAFHAALLYLGHEPPLKADFALIGAKRCDYQGNLDYALTARNFNPVMAMAGTTVIVEPAEIVPTGVIPPDDVVTPHVLVDHIIEMDRSHG